MKTIINLGVPTLLTFAIYFMWCHVSNGSNEIPEWAKFPFVFFAFNFIYTDLRDYRHENS